MQVSEIRHTCAQVIAKIAGAELPKKQWPDLVQNLQNNVATGGTPGLKEATLEALGYVCEEVEHDHLEEAEVNAMLTAIVQGMRKEEPDNEIRLAATVALANALFFAESNFERENERNYIMQVTCEATVCTDVRVRQAAYEVLVGVAENYYDKLQPYMTAVFDLTLKATKSDEETVALQAIEFWSAVCEEEVDRQEDIEEEGEGTTVVRRSAVRRSSPNAPSPVNLFLFFFLFFYHPSSKKKESTRDSYIASHTHLYTRVIPRLSFVFTRVDAGSRCTTASSSRRCPCWCPCCSRR